MAGKAPKGFGDMPSSGDLGRLVLCELEFVHERTTGRTRQDAGTVLASRRGEQEHLKAQVAMESFHNRPAAAPAPPSAPSSAPSSVGPKDGRCFVASAVYGASASQTEQLRGFRDQVLQRSAAGRAVVRLYYRTSPPAARWLGDHPSASHLVRKLLDGILWVLGCRFEIKAREGPD